MWDTRIAKLRVSADRFVREQEAHAKVGAWLALPPQLRPSEARAGLVLLSNFPGRPAR